MSGEYRTPTVSTGLQSVKLSSGEHVPYSVQQREVSNPRLSLNPDGTLAVVVPPDTPGHRIVSKEREWIESQYESQQAQLSTLIEEHGNLTEGFILWGRPYELRPANGNYAVSIDGDILSVVTPEGESYLRYLRGKIIDALKTAIRTLANKFCSEIEQEYEKLTVRSQRTKWASCSSGTTLNFNLRCAFLPISHLRYLVAHEVAHLAEKSHNDNFWRLVESIAPRYKSKRADLQGFWYAVHHNALWQNLIE